MLARSAHRRPDRDACAGMVPDRRKGLSWPRSRLAPALNPAEGAERSFEDRGVEVFDDKDEARTLVPVWPCPEMAWCMDEMLDRMDRHRCPAVGNVQDTLDPQQVIAVTVQQHRQPDAEPRPIDRHFQS